MRKRLFIGFLLAIAIAGVILLLSRSETRHFYQGKTIETWARLAYSGDAGAITAFQTMGTNAVPELIRLLQAKDPLVRRQGWNIWRKMPLSMRRLLPALQPPDTVAVRAGAIRALGIIGPEAREAVPGLGQVLRGHNHQESADAAAALARIGKSSVPALVDALDDSQGTVRRPAAYALAQIGPEAYGAMPALSRLLLDSDRTTREAAAYALQNIGGPATKTLSDVMVSGDEAARSSAVKALLLITGSLRQAEPGLVAMAQSTNAASRRQALEALGAIRMPDNTTINTLTQALNDPAIEVRVAAANALANVSMRGERAVPALIKCLDDATPELRQAAARTLGLIGLPAKTAAPKLTLLLGDTNEWVRAAAKEALARVAP